MLSHTAEQIMTRNVISIRKGATVEQAIKLMSRHHLSGLPVVDVDGRLEGVISERDLLLRGQGQVEADYTPLAFASVAGEDRISEFYRKANSTLVEEAMSSTIVAFQPESLVSDIARVMVEKNVNRVPIVSAGRLVGIISRQDIIRSMALLPFGADDRSDNERIEL